MQNEPHWLPVEDVIAHNRDLVAKTGEQHVLRDPGLLDSACAKPQNHYAYGEEDILVLAVSLLVGITQNHPFIQGNKRTGFVSAVDFLELNGYTLDVALDQVLGMLIEAMVNGGISEDDLVQVLRPSIVVIAE